MAKVIDPFHGETLVLLKPHPDHPAYLVTHLGDVFSIRSGRWLRPPLDNHGYLRVSLGGVTRTRRVHRVVLETWRGPKPPGLECRHLNDVKSDNRLANLAWGTRTENLRDSVRNGSHHGARKTRCIHGHPFDEANTYVNPSGSRACRTCQRERDREYQERNRERISDYQAEYRRRNRERRREYDRDRRRKNTANFDRLSDT